MKPVRIRFQKTGDGKFISHLDLNRTMIFALRRAGLPVWYTEGFNPHPYITFALALPLGTESLCEIMDFRLTEEDFPVHEIPARMNAQLPDSLRVTDAYERLTKPVGIAYARYQIDTNGTPPPEILAAFFARERILTEKPLSKKRLKKGGPVSETVDLRDKILAPGIGADSFTLALPCGDTDSVAPKLIVSAISEYTGESFLPGRILRTGLLDAALRDFR